MDNKDIQLFEDQPIRTAWDGEREEWYFSVVDVIGVLTDSKDPAAYWRKLKQRLREEGNETVTNCHALKMTAADGKRRMTDVADTEQLLRLIQSIPSPKAEPFKLWLAQVGRDRIEETIDPELAIDRAWSGMTTRQYKNLKGLKKENLRDNMTTTEIILNMLAETATKDITAATKPTGLEENRAAARQGGRIAGNARREIEESTGAPVITSANAAQLNDVVTGMITAMVEDPDKE